MRHTRDTRRSPDRSTRAGSTRAQDEPFGQLGTEPGRGNPLSIGRGPGAKPLPPGHSPQRGRESQPRVTQTRLSSSSSSTREGPRLVYSPLPPKGVLPPLVQTPDCVPSAGAAGRLSCPANSESRGPQKNPLARRTPGATSPGPAPLSAPRGLRGGVGRRGAQRAQCQPSPQRSSPGRQPSGRLLGAPQGRELWEAARSREFRRSELPAAGTWHGHCRGWRLPPAPELWSPPFPAQARPEPSARKAAGSPQ